MPALRRVEIRARRPALALGASVAIHAAAMALALGVATWRSWPALGRMDLAPITVEVKELPLGGPPTAAEASAEPAARTRVRPRRARSSREVTLGARGPDGGADPGSAHARAQGDAGAGPGAATKRDLRRYGPEGSRVVALLRLDRLRGAPDARAAIAATDQILKLLPDRRRLVDGTGLDLYRDFDALLVATPNPFDDTVTLLVARHRLTEDALRAALDRGAAAAGRSIDWRVERGRPVGVRVLRRPDAGSGLPEEPTDRDGRIFVLPEDGLAVMAPPAYAELLLGRRRGEADGGRAQGRDAGAAAVPEPEPTTWQDLALRIDAEDGAMPEDAFLMLTGSGLRAFDPAAGMVPPTRGVVEEPDGAPGGGRLPHVFSVVASLAPGLALELSAEWTTEAEAEGWLGRWPALRDRLTSNPLIALGGFVPLVQRVEIERDRDTIRVHTSATRDETLRLFDVVVRLAGGRKPGP